MALRVQNERKFGRWEELPNGGRRYFRDFIGRAGGRALYIKEVNASETTTHFAQEIFDGRPSHRCAREISRRFGLQINIRLM